MGETESETVEDEKLRDEDDNLLTNLELTTADNMTVIRKNSNEELESAENQFEFERNCLSVNHKVEQIESKESSCAVSANENKVRCNTWKEDYIEKLNENAMIKKRKERQHNLKIALYSCDDWLPCKP